MNYNGNHSIMNCRFDNNTQILDISGNSLTYLNKTSLRNMGVISLTQLNASRNSISDIHGEAFFGQSKLQTLDLSSNNLSYIEPWAFTRNPSLEWLSLSGNGFGMLPEEGYFLYSDSVRVLHLSACNLRHIPTETFQDLPNLQELYISHNLIDILPPLGTGFLTVLDVSNNNLRDLDSDIFTSSPKIIRLNLSYNGLRTLNIEMLPQLAKVIRTDDLSGNPWVCDCVMFNTTYSWCRNNGVDLNLTCSRPPKFKDQKWTVYDREGCVENIFDEVDEFTVTGNGSFRYRVPNCAGCK
ncbi:Vasorin [Zootermopsis nevadensis]|uniref:Vasorin n=1 Tax=Zootermopsis nevadensis TaxID=136037 RepID=A0A067RIA5_ZOONE|nr:Vasorin [Zootermopsis nevadensis]